MLDLNSLPPIKTGQRNLNARHSAEHFFENPCIAFLQQTMYNSGKSKKSLHISPRWIVILSEGVRKRRTLGSFRLMPESLKKSLPRITKISTNSAAGKSETRQRRRILRRTRSSVLWTLPKPMLISKSRKRCCIPSLKICAWTGSTEHTQSLWMRLKSRTHPQ